MRIEYLIQSTCVQSMRIFPPAFLTTALIVVSLGSHAVAGGGGGGSVKANHFVRIKNTCSGPTAGAQSAPLISIDTVRVSDSGNAAFAAGGLLKGRVDDEFRIATREVTIAQYAAFLAAVAKTKNGSNDAVVDSLYDPRMASDANIAGIVRAGSGSAGAPYLYSVAGDPNKPVTYVSWFNAARFANWLHNGGTEGSDMETGAYTLAGLNPERLTRNGDAIWWIPSDNEWFKAAYYKGGGNDAGYWRFPTRSDQLPGNSASAEPNQANFKRNGLFSVTQSDNLSANENYLTAVGTFVNTPGPYGTFDQGGNADEWTEDNIPTTFGVERITRGGAWSTGGLNRDVSPLPTALPGNRLNKLGFRLARSSNTVAGPGLSGDFDVTVRLNQQRVNAGFIATFGVKPGEFTVVAKDPANPSMQVSAKFSSGQNRTTYLLLSVAGGVISLTEAPAGETF